MSQSTNFLVITASNGENLKLAKRFIEIGHNLNASSELIDLTTVNLPLYNPRTYDTNNVPKDLLKLSKKMESIPRWVICAPEYNGSIPPIFTNALALLSLQSEDFRNLFNGRPIAIASFSGGGGMELLISLRIQLTHLGSEVIGRQLMSNHNKPPKDESIRDILNRLLTMNPISNN